MPYVERRYKNAKVLDKYYCARLDRRKEENKQKAAEALRRILTEDLQDTGEVMIELSYQPSTRTEKSHRKEARKIRRQLKKSYRKSKRQKRRKYWRQLIVGKEVRA